MAEKTPAPWLVDYFSKNGQPGTGWFNSRAEAESFAQTIKSQGATDVNVSPSSRARGGKVGGKPTKKRLDRR